MVKGKWKIVQIIPAVGWRVEYQNMKQPTSPYSEPVACWALIEAVNAEAIEELAGGEATVVGLVPGESGWDLDFAHLTENMIGYVPDETGPAE